MSTGDTVHVWLVDTRLPEPVVAELCAVLDDDERRRADDLGDADGRRRFVVAHGVARVLAGERLDAPPGGLCWQYGPHGKPSLVGVDLQVNLSHSGELAAVALSARRRVGVDLQRRAAGVDAARMAARWYPPDEAAHVGAAPDPDEGAARFDRLWARKEACVKVAGGQLVPGLRLAVLGISPVPVAGPDGPYLVHDLPAPPGFAAAVALDGADGYDVAQRWWRHPSRPAPDPCCPDPLAVR